MDIIQPSVCIDKREILSDYINKFKDLPSQGSKEWLDGRKFSIGGSEMGTIVGHNPYKNIRGLIEGHLGITVFNGNINTYWGTILECLVVDILEKKLYCKIYETGSLPGVIDTQGYSPDGLVYLESLDKIVLIEIKSAARRIADGKIPRMYKPQVYTGLDTIQIADMGLFVDALFRRCNFENFEFTSIYDTTIHPDKPLGVPLALCMICIYEELYSTEYDAIKHKYGKNKNEWIDAGGCTLEDLELILRDTSQRKLKFFMPSFVEYSDDDVNPHGVSIMLEEFINHTMTNNYEPIAIMPLKLFKLELIPAYRDDWKKKYNRKTRKWEMGEEPSDKTFVMEHKETIERVIDQIRILDKMSTEDQMIELDNMYPPKGHIPRDLIDELVNSLM
jgi:hypothetical protein